MQSTDGGADLQGNHSDGAPRSLAWIEEVEMQIEQMLLVAKAKGIRSEVCCGGELDDGGEATSVESCSAEIIVSCHLPSNEESGDLWRKYLGQPSSLHARKRCNCQFP